MGQLQPGETYVTRVPTQVHTRKLDRSVAHTMMQQRGKKRVNKHDRYSYKNPYGATITVDSGSYFSEHWREFSNYVPTIDLRRNKK